MFKVNTEDVFKRAKKMVEDLTEEVQTLHIQKEEVINGELPRQLTVNQRVSCYASPPFVCIAFHSTGVEIIKLVIIGFVPFLCVGCKDCPAHGGSELEEISGDHS